MPHRLGAAAAESTVVHFRLQNVANARQPAREKAPADNGSSVSAADTQLRLALDLLGAFELKRADGQLLRLPKKAQALLAYLALQKGRPIPREQLATLLWGNSATEQARQSLRQCLAALRNALGAEASESIVADTASVLLAPSELLAIDVAAFEAACQSKTVADMQRASALYRDELLDRTANPVEPFNDWLTLERQRLSRCASISCIGWRVAQGGGARHGRRDRRRQARHGARSAPRGRASPADAAAGIIRQSQRRAQAARALRADPARRAGHRPRGRDGAARGGDPRRPQPGSRAKRAAGDPAGGQQEAAPVPPTAPTGPPLPDKPSIVVLPFANLTGDASQDYFVDGLVEDITVALGRETWLFVIASPSAFAFKDRSADPRDVAAKLGVRYVLRGSVRRDGNRVRIVVQLTDAATGAHIWSHRFEDEADNVFAMNDRLMTQAAAMIAPALRSVEIERAQRKPTSSLTAFDLYLQALPLFQKSLADNRRSAAAARQGRRDSIPSYSTAFGFAARCYQFQKLHGLGAAE